MKHWEVTQFLRDLTILADYLQTLVNKKGEPEPCTNFSLNYAIQKNFTRFTKAVELINKSINPKLVELENKAFELIKAQNEIINKENEADKVLDIKDKKEPKKLLTLMEGIGMLTEKEQKDHSKLMIEYNKAMEEENEVEIYKVKAEKVEDVPMELAYMPILEKMVD